MITTSTLIAVPAVASIIILLVPFARRAAGYLALLVSLAVLGGVIGFIYRFEPIAGYQFADNVAWITPLGIRWHVAMNGVSLAMVAITALIIACVIGFAMWAGRDRSHASFALILMTEAFLILVFTARDLFAFYVGFEGMLIPLLVLLAIWGGAGRKFATLQVIAYTALGTLLMLLGILYLGLTAPGGPNFDMELAIGRGNDWVFFAFAIAMAIKSPLFPLHGWVMPAYRESSPEIAAVLSGVASKAGGFAFLAILVPLFPAQAAHYAWIFITLGAIGFLWASFIAFRQPDSRGVVAYSSIAQMSLAEAAGGTPDTIIIATGSEVHDAMSARETLQAEGLKVRVVSMPSWEIFELEDEAYRASVLPAAIMRRVSFEVGVTQGWERWVGDAGISVGIDHYGASAPGAAVAQGFGLTADAVVAAVRALR